MANSLYPLSHLKSWMVLSLNVTDLPIGALLVYTFQVVSHLRKCPSCLFSSLLQPFLHSNHLLTHSLSFKDSYLPFVFTEFKEQGAVKRYVLKTLTPRPYPPLLGPRIGIIVTRFLFHFQGLFCS